MCLRDRAPENAAPPATRPLCRQIRRDAMAPRPPLGLVAPCSCSFLTPATTRGRRQHRQTRGTITDYSSHLLCPHCPRHTATRHAPASTPYGPKGREGRVHGLFLFGRLHPSGCSGHGQQVLACLRTVLAQLRTQNSIAAHSNSRCCSECRRGRSHEPLGSWHWHSIPTLHFFIPSGIPGLLAACSALCLLDATRRRPPSAAGLSAARLLCFGCAAVPVAACSQRGLPSGLRVLAAAARGPARAGWQLSYSRFRPAAGSLMLRHRRPPIRQLARLSRKPAGWRSLQ